MPASRRGPRNVQRGAQSTLSFGSRSKVTKPSVSSGQSIKKDVALHQDDVKRPASPASEVDVQPTTAELAIREQAKEEVKKVARTKEEELAAKIDDAQLKRYWKERDAERKAPRGVLLTIITLSALQRESRADCFAMLMATSPSRRS